MYKNAVMLNSFQHPYQIRTQPNKQPGSRIHVRDDNKMQGFTLIELLVVVLIIGILSAVALPQYQKAVEKSRAAEALTLLTAMGRAQELYYLSNGEYASALDDLDVDVPRDGKTFSVSVKYASGLMSGAVAEVARTPRYQRYTFLYMPQEQKIICFSHASKYRKYCLAAGVELAPGSY